MAHDAPVPEKPPKIGNGQVGGQPAMEPGRAMRRRRGSGGRTDQRYSKTPRLGSYEVSPARDVTTTRLDGSENRQPTCDAGPSPGRRRRTRT